ncbi:MAG: tRNA (adenosine(37)-N6)-threonylcarbamoyltransferase complex dimerization subunit type 1 TsaB [Thermodesulfovibrionales bacterium]|nr:tRNA (adenosine(37)-N6)-threonylcarbamoyltransferase complex dimerization subunit type 1 TsaB [Thermodesulfovibrionales bacterium]
MKILAIETSTITGGVAIIEDKKLLAEGRMSVKAIYSERLMALIDFLLTSVKISITDIDYFALAVGPGSFTGLRVGLSTAKGLAFTTGKLVAPVSTLKAMAMNLPFVNYPICPILDARKGEVYWAIYRNGENKLDTLINDRVGNVNDIFPFIKEQTIFIGEGALIYKKEIQQALNEKVILGNGIEMFPSPYNVALLGYQQVLEGNLLDAFKINTVYFRKSEAEIKKGI